MKFDYYVTKRIIRLIPLVAITSLYMGLVNLYLFNHGYSLWSCSTTNAFDLFVDMFFGGKNIINCSAPINVPVWYINVLMLCYVLAYILTMLAQKWKTKYIYMLPIFAGLMMFYTQTNYIFWNVNISRGYISFFLGIYLYMIMKKMDTLSFKRKCIIKMALVFELLLMLFISKSGLAGEYHKFYTFLVFPEFLLILYNCKWINAICSNKIICHLGNISFGIYMWNFPILISFHTLILKGILTIDITSVRFVLINIFVHIVVASISYLLIDKKLCSFINKNILPIKEKI